MLLEPEACVTEHSFCRYALERKEAQVDQPSPPAALRQMLTGFWMTQCLYAAARLGIADVVAEGPRPVAELATRVHANPSALYRLLRALASVGVFAEVGSQCFEQTPLSSLLREGTSDSLRGLALLLGTISVPVWAQIVHSVQTGQPAVETVLGSSLFEYLDHNPEAAKIFDEAMAGQTVMIARAVSAAHDFSRYQTIVDIGGGKGALIAEILEAAPRSRGINFDQPAVAERARLLLQSKGVAERCQTIGGDFFVEIPSGGDAYLLKFVLHDWSDEDCARILRNTRAAMAGHGVLLVIESVIPPGNESYPGKFMDVNMLVMTGGRERTESEYRTLLERGGFRLRRVTSAHPMASIIEAMPA
jgi:O-methyltransferase domain/Dimerisation domain